MISRMAENALHLTPVDQNAARCYIPTLQLFPFPHDAQVEAAVKALAGGLQATLKKFPFLAGTIGPADPTTGELSFRYPTDTYDVQEAGLFAFERLTSPGEFAYTYAQLKERGMPPSALTGSQFCPQHLRNRPGIPENAEGLMDFEHAVPAIAVQAFFIPGGLILSIYVQHNVMDCAGVNSFWKHFAENVSCQSTMQRPSGRRVPDQSALRSQLDARIPVFEKPPTADAFTSTKFEYQKTLPTDTPCSAKVFVLSAARIQKFRDQLRRSLPDGTRLTICNVLAALVWIHVTRARAGHLEKCGDTNVGIAVDCRRRLDPPLDGEYYMGDMAVFAKASMPVAESVDEQTVTAKTVLATALNIHRAISRVDNPWVERHLAFFKSKIPIKDTEPALKFKFGPDIYVTSWMNFGADHRWNIPGTTSESPEYVRRPVDRGSDGGIMIMPRSRKVVDGKEAPYEVLIRLASEDMGRLEKEAGGLTKWAERIIE